VFISYANLRSKQCFSSDFHTDSDDIYFYDWQGNDGEKWVLMEEKLATPRNSHLAFKVKAKFVNC